MGTGRISLRPSRSAAEAFYASFAQENALLAELVPGAADFFSDDFSMYPEEAIEIDSLVEDSEFLRVLQALGLARS